MNQLFISVPAHHWHECALVSVSACSCVNGNVREKECYKEMNERNDDYIKKLQKKEAE